MHLYEMGYARRVDIYHVMACFTSLLVKIRPQMDLANLVCWLMLISHLNAIVH